MQVDHIGIVVEDVDAYISELCSLLLLDSENIKYDKVDAQDVEIALVHLNNICIEVIQPISTRSTVYSFLKRGGGIHHICYLVDNIDAFIKDHKKNMKIIRKKERGLLGRYTAFFVTRDSFSLFEIIEPKNDEGKSHEKNSFIV